MDSGLTPSQCDVLLDYARKTISCRLNPDEEIPEISEAPLFQNKAATFVTLKIQGQLRGCIGHLEPVTSLWESVRDNAVGAAFQDHRFPPLSPGEFEKIEIDISVLSAPSVLEYKDSAELVRKLRPGIDGVIMSDGCRGATFLPQVWGQLQTTELFLGQLCRKAGLDESAWRKGNLEIKVYQVFCFGEGGR